nr:esterase-like activity of phytase family protein [Brevundimonas lenta]
MILTACAATATVAPPLSGAPGWIASAAETRPVGLGLPGGAQLADGVRFAGGVELVAAPASPLHSLSDLKLTGPDAFVSVTDAGDLIRGRLVFDRKGDLAGLAGLEHRRLTLLDGGPIMDKADGDAEGLAITRDGDLLISFERDHRIWNYGPADQPGTPRSVRIPDFAFTLNDGIEGLSTSPSGWRAAGESGGVWDCTPAVCVEISAPPAAPLVDSDYRVTGMDRDPSGDGFFVVQRSYTPPVDARARIRRMAPDGSLGPVLVELKLPGTTDNFEGVAAVRHGDGVRLYILSDDNSNEVQRTLLLAFDVVTRPARRS